MEHDEHANGLRRTSFQTNCSTLDDSSKLVPNSQSSPKTKHYLIGSKKDWTAITTDLDLKSRFQDRLITSSEDHFTATFLCHFFSRCWKGWKMWSLSLGDGWHPQYNLGKMENPSVVDVIFLLKTGYYIYMYIFTYYISTSIIYIYIYISTCYTYNYIHIHLKARSAAQLSLFMSKYPMRSTDITKDSSCASWSDCSDHNWKILEGCPRKLVKSW